MMAAVNPDVNELDTEPDTEQHQHAEDAPDEAPEELKFARQVATTMGWAPKEDWRGRPEAWTDAPDYLKSLSQQHRSLKDQIRGIGRVAEKAADDARRRGYEDARAEFEKAVADGDTEGAAKASQRMTSATGPDPQVGAWIARNPWFNTHTAANGLARGVSAEGERAGKSVAEQLEDAENEVKRRFPELFGDTMAQPRSQPPVMQGSRRAVGGAPVKKGFRDLPKQAQDAWRNHFRSKMTEEQYYTAYQEDHDENG